MLVFIDLQPVLCPKIGFFCCFEASFGALKRQELPRQADFAVYVKNLMYTAKNCFFYCFCWHTPPVAQSFKLLVDS